MLFALVAGAATALSPCVLPVLPAVLGGRRRRRAPAAARRGHRAGARVHVRDRRARLRDRRARPARRPRAHARDRHPVRLRDHAAGAAVGDRIEACVSRIVARPGADRAATASGPGCSLGASLGLVYTPCAGPILAGVITVSAAQDFTAGQLAVALAYAVGSARGALRADARRAPAHRPAASRRAAGSRRPRAR